MTTVSSLQFGGSMGLALRRFSGYHSDFCPDDAQLSIEVKLALLRACPTLADTIAISTQDGVVYLRGSVASERKLVHLYKAARTVPGIQWICNDVTVVRPAQQDRVEFSSPIGVSVLPSPAGPFGPFGQSGHLAGAA